jgi:two-component system, OmpR family, catabolic regulation response regulator CreB
MPARILIIEEEPALAEAVAFRLGSDGFLPEIRATGTDALLALRNVTFDLILLDIGLPDANGFDLFQAIRTLCAAPILFVTGRAQAIDRVAGLELGADDYIVKPFCLRELVARVRAALRRVRPVAPVAPERARVFRVDEEGRQILYHDQALALTRFKYGILRLLIRRSGRILSREELLDQVWEHPEERCDRAIDAHVKALRAKLDVVKPGLSPIRTHRGEGYALEEA